MRGRRLVVAVVFGFFAAAAWAQSVGSTARGVVVAHDGVVELRGAWSTDGVRNAGRIIVGTTRVAVLDPLANRARIVELENGRALTVQTAETPIDGLFFGNDLYVVARDGQALQRFAVDGTIASVHTAADPSFLRESNGRIYVYARVGGVLHEVDPIRMTIRREVKVAPFAADFEVDQRNAYLVDARAAKMHVVTLETMRPAGDIDVGAVPVDVAFATGATAASARTLAVADPSAKRVWLVEGVQSMTQAVARGFLRGLLGLGLFSARDSQFPTGVDRVFVRGSKWLAYDSASRTLYRFTKSKSSAVATGVGPNGFALTADGVVWWDDAVRRLQKVAY